ncbi:MAG: DUF975 family protein [Oscillospiraceae bacterium]|nr:DUF975 family protein [Oscillospiraceae bacterium]
MNLGQLKREARLCILTPRKSGVLSITLLYLILIVLLLELVFRLSDIGRFQTELAENLLPVAEDLFRPGVLQAILPEMSFTIPGTFFFIVPWVFRWVLDLGYLYYARSVVKNEPQSPRSLFEGFTYFRKAVTIRLIQTVLTIGGLILFIFPGIWVFTAFSQANLILLDHPGKGALWCLKESNRLMRGRKVEFFALFISFLGWWLLTTIPFITYLALFWYLPYTTFTYVNYYNKLTGKPSQDGGWKKPGMF